METYKAAPHTVAPNTIIRRHVALAAGAGVIPLPLADIGAIASIQYSLIKEMAEAYGQKLDHSRIKAILGAVVTGTLSRVGASLIQVIPLVGSLLGSMSVSLSAALSTYALGQALKNHFEQGGTIHNFDVQQLKKWYHKASKTGAPMVKSILPSWLGGASSDLQDKLDQLQDLLDRGIIDEEVYENARKQIHERKG